MHGAVKQKCSGKKTKNRCAEIKWCWSIFHEISREGTRERERESVVGKFVPTWARRLSGPCCVVGSFEVALLRFSRMFNTDNVPLDSLQHAASK